MPRTHSDDVELDLHELTVEQALDEFVRFYNRRLSAGRTGAISVVHGYLHGARIKRQLHALLAAHRKELTFEPGEHLDGNPGWTRVYPKSALPAAVDALQARIVQFCQTPKTRDKIDGEFRRHPPAEVTQALKKLVKSGQLLEIKGAIKRYRSSAR